MGEQGRLGRSAVVVGAGGKSVGDRGPGRELELGVRSIKMGGGRKDGIFLHDYEFMKMRMGDGWRRESRRRKFSRYGMK